MRILKTLHWSRSRSGSVVPGIQQQQPDNIVVREIKDTSGLDEMWSPGSPAGHHHRELPVDVPDTLLQQAYPNKVKFLSKKSLNLPEIEKQKPAVKTIVDTTTTTTAPDQKTVSDPPAAVVQATTACCSSPISVSEITLSIDNDGKVVTKNNNNPFEEDFLEADLSNQKESSVDVDEDYPFAKEGNYPTILKSCSDDSGASLRSSPDRSNKTGIVASFENPAYGLMRAEQVSDLTQLINSQEQLNRINVGTPKKSKKPKKDKSKGPKESEELLLGKKSSHQDELQDLEPTSLSRTHRKKKQYSSSGYSTLRSDASAADLDQVDSAAGRSFLVLNGNKNYRELAVDCPADFVPQAKCHPVYPPPNRTPQGTLGKSKDRPNSVDVKNNNCQLEPKRSLPPAPKIPAVPPVVERRFEKKSGLNGVRPAIPPRDQKRAPARPPKDNIRASLQNNNVVVEDNDVGKTEPTQQQLHSIRKYQEEFRQRKVEEERQESLNRSLRAGSVKLKALEQSAASLPGVENLAFAQDEVTLAAPPPLAAKTPGTPKHSRADSEETTRPLTYGEVVATLERLQLQLRDVSGSFGISGAGVEAELEAVKTLLVQKRFAAALQTHHALKNKLRTPKMPTPNTDDASNLARDCLEVLEQWQATLVESPTDVSAETLTDVEELTILLTSYEMEGLLLAHDSIAGFVEGLQIKQGADGERSSPSSSCRESRIAENIKIIRIDKTNEPLGATVRNEGDAVVIGRVVRGGAADKSGLLHEGDEVLEVNGVEMRGKNVNDVCDILASMQGALTFLILPAPETYKNNHKLEEPQQIHHVRAHFDYDPEEDPYIPCRELGVGFQKGDVLHVISQEDANWWQAYREGEEDQALAGLIPSKAFQHQRESMKQTMAGDKSSIRGSKKSSTLLCARKNPKKKKRSKLGGNVNDDGFPLYATTSIDDYDNEEVLTYEEVALYYPRANHKRPIVLIGPPNIGRHELRQRLMQDSEKFAAAVPHTSRTRKDSEVDGQDYHFISRQQFETDILCRKFVEHGEYEKAYYGTSIEAIRGIVNSGKICVLNLHPQSLKILRNSDLKPYVVFVAPPSLEKLRQKRIKNNEAFKEEELKDIIEKAREMEDKYGHLFDMIIINNDTNRAYDQLLAEINSLEREPQWVPASWIQ